jgi:hypothetical protein
MNVERNVVIADAGSSKTPVTEAALTAGAAGSAAVFLQMVWDMVVRLPFDDLILAVTTAVEVVICLGAALLWGIPRRPRTITLRLPGCSS